ncbi:hypothetical protein HWD35_21915 [Tsukamurella tyrosinosolvens]|uniref:Uncharacterized protein n=1 Tax=Tsukamurella tyrosinosolvens TaxID=57704 RepID=A0A1H4KXC4_TSUTY|nr:hypothetical protein [Tsukamurella tyrosinosolvens]AUN38714.1 hypothetical protein ASU32_00780 [Tsukamurella tyrosinosolvens]KXO96433.1 hypothetical protein AXK58_03820 [Tsukamurella tyrosinosolvens]KXP01206.1 hypothetical protein AXK59_23205 [Tsukamurella tyrosinosolvens]MCA4997386.1 hypothetical protein [Tsukamurella tyrosinosolvens]MEC4613828.1 hypothetical protein [Tsukamurella tyrosinosolvens]
MTTVIVAVGGAVGSVLGYRLVARGPRWTTMLCVTALVSVLLGGVARLVRIVGDTGLAAVPVALLGPIVTFTGIGWWLVASPRGDWRRAVLVVGGGVAAAILGYLSIDLMGLAYIKFPRFG